MGVLITAPDGVPDGKSVKMRACARIISTHDLRLSRSFRVANWSRRNAAGILGLRVSSESSLCMSDFLLVPETVPVADIGDAPSARKRPKPGERRTQILQALAAMLEQPGAERITTAALAARLSVSEAALYRHFASKAQMFEGLIEFIEQTVFALLQQITGRDLPDGLQPPDVGTRQAARIVAVLLQFGERNPGMVRVMVGDAMVYEHERLQQRMNQFFERI